MSIGQKTVKAIQRRYGTSYLVGPISTTICKLKISLSRVFSFHKGLPYTCEILFFTDPAAGGSIDWVYDATNTNLSFVFEFRDHRDGNM